MQFIIPRGELLLLSAIAWGVFKYQWK